MNMTTLDKYAELVKNLILLALITSPIWITLVAVFS